MVNRKEIERSQMEKLQNQIGSDKAGNNQIITDDLAFSAYLRMKGYHLIKSDQRKSKSTFVFDIGAEDQNSLKVHFINSEFLSYYNELRNMKKLI
jgi:hypothetical protein